MLKNSKDIFIEKKIFREKRFNKVQVKKNILEIVDCYFLIFSKYSYNKYSLKL